MWLSLVIIGPLFAHIKRALIHVITQWKSVTRTDWLLQRTWCSSNFLSYLLLNRPTLRVMDYQKKIPYIARLSIWRSFNSILRILFWSHKDLNRASLCQAQSLLWLLIPFFLVELRCFASPGSSFWHNAGCHLNAVFRCTCCGLLSPASGRHSLVRLPFFILKIFRPNIWYSKF